MRQGTWINAQEVCNGLKILIKVLNLLSGNQNLDCWSILLGMLILKWIWDSKKFSSLDNVLRLSLTLSESYILTVVIFKRDPRHYETYSCKIACIRSTFFFKQNLIHDPSQYGLLCVSYNSLVYPSVKFEWVFWRSSGLSHTACAASNNFFALFTLIQVRNHFLMFKD